MFINSDFSDLLRLLGANDVRYLVVGGYAVVQYAEPRYTKDLDVWIRADADNAKAIFKALREFGAPLSGLTEADFATEGYFYQMGVPPVRIDILMGIPGVKFDEAWQRRFETDFDGLMVSFISKQDLIQSKLASGRPQDLIDAESLSSAAKQAPKRLLVRRKAVKAKRE